MRLRNLQPLRFRSPLCVEGCTRHQPKGAPRGPGSRSTAAAVLRGRGSLQVHAPNIHLWRVGALCLYGIPSAVLETCSTPADGSVTESLDGHVVVTAAAVTPTRRRHRQLGPSIAWHTYCVPHRRMKNLSLQVPAPRLAPGAEAVRHSFHRRSNSVRTGKLGCCPSRGDDDAEWAPSCLPLRGRPGSGASRCARSRGSLLAALAARAQVGPAGVL